MPLRNGQRQVQLLEIHDISLKASVSTAGPGDILTRFTQLSTDFAALQEQYSRFQADFRALASDVRHVEGELGRVAELREELFDVKANCENLRTQQQMAAGRTQELEDDISDLENETSRIDSALQRFESDHPPAALLFEKRSDCLGEHEGLYTNALMREHQARLDADACQTKDTTAQNEEKGWTVQLPEGQHTVPDMREREATVSDQPKAIRITTGFEATIFEFSNLSGEMRHLYEGDHVLEDFPKVGAIRLQRLRTSEQDIGRDLATLRKDFDARERAFGDLRNDLIREFDSRGEDNQNKVLTSIMDLERRASKLEESNKVYYEDIEHLRASKAEKGENKDLPEQIKYLHDTMKKLEAIVDTASKSLADKADMSMVTDKVTRDEVQEFVDAIQRLLQIGGPYAYTGSRSECVLNSTARTGQVFQHFLSACLSTNCTGCCL